MLQVAKRVLLAGALLAAFGAGNLSAAEQKVVLKVYGMFCQVCANGVAGSLKNLKGVRSAEVRVTDAKAQVGEAAVTYEDAEITAEQIRKQIESSGFSTTPPR